MQNVDIVQKSSQSVLDSIETLDVAFEKMFQSSSFKEELLFLETKQNLRKISQKHEIPRSHKNRCDQSRKLAKLSTENIALKAEIEKLRARADNTSSDAVKVALIQRDMAKERNVIEQEKMLIDREKNEINRNLGHTKIDMDKEIGNETIETNRLKILVGLILFAVYLLISVTTPGKELGLRMPLSF